MVSTINNFPVTIEEFCNSNTIYGWDVPTLKGKPVHQQSKRVQVEYKEVLGRLQESIGNMTVESDVMFMNRIQFVINVLIGANFTMVEYVSQRSKTVLTNSIGTYFQFYKNNGYNINIS